MLHESILLALLLGSTPGFSPPQATEVCATVPATPTRIDARPFSSTAADGTQTWGATASYQLSSGALGEAFMVVDSAGVGEAQLMIDGEIIAHVAIELPTSSAGPVVTTWMPATVDAAPEAIAEMMRVDLPVVLAESLPQEKQCTPAGKKARVAAAWLLRAATIAASASCCIGSTVAAPVGCLVCATGIGLAGEAVAGTLTNICD